MCVFPAASSTLQNVQNMSCCSQVGAPLFLLQFSVESLDLSVSLGAFPLCYCGSRSKGVVKGQAWIFGMQNFLLIANWITELEHTNFCFHLLNPQHVADILQTVYNRVELIQPLPLRASKQLVRRMCIQVFLK